MIPAVDKYRLDKSALSGLISVLLAILFFSVAASKYLLRIDILLAPFEKAMANPLGKEIINALSPIIFLGGSLAALILSLMTVAGLKFQPENKNLAGLVTIKGNVWNSAVVPVSLALVWLPLGYLVAENWQGWVGLKATR